MKYEYKEPTEQEWEIRRTGKLELHTEDYIVYTRTEDGIYYSWMPVPKSPVEYWRLWNGFSYKVYDIGPKQQ